MVKITIHHNVFAQRLSVSTKMAQPHVYHQVLYLAGEGGHRLSGPHPSSPLAVRFATHQLTFPFGCGFWSRQVEGPDRKGIRNSSWGENIVNKHQTSGGVSFSMEPTPTL